MHVNRSARGDDGVAGDMGEIRGGHGGDLGEICTLIGRLVVTMASPESASCAAFKRLGIG